MYSAALGAMAFHPTPERRRWQRVEIKAHVRVRRINGAMREVSARSKDVTAEGMFFWLDETMTEGCRVELILLLPSREGSEERLFLWSVGKVVRTEASGSGGEHGMAVSFDEVEIAIIPAQRGGSSVRREI